MCHYHGNDTYSPCSWDMVTMETHILCVITMAMALIHLVLGTWLLWRHTYFVSLPWQWHLFWAPCSWDMVTMETHILLTENMEFEIEVAISQG